MKYTTYIFDLDDTLLDFKKSEEKSFLKILSDLNVSTDENYNMYSRYQTISEKLWRDFEQDLYSKDFIKVERFKRLCDEFNLMVDPKDVSEKYLEYLSITVCMMKGAKEICKWIKSQGSNIVIATNGIAEVQRVRVKESGLLKFIDHLIVSEDCGYAKPKIEFFNYMFSFFGNTKKEECLMVGDRLETDILGANRFGIDSCWFNPNKIKNSLKIQPTYDIKDLETLSYSKLYI